MSSCLIVVSGSIGGIVKALLIRQSTRPYSSRVASTSRWHASSSLMSVGTTSARRPCDRTTSAILSSRFWVLDTSTRSAPSLAASSPSERPSPGPTPDSTTTLSCNSCGSPVTSDLLQFAERADMVGRTTPTGQKWLIVRRLTGSCGGPANRKCPLDPSRQPKVPARHAANQKCPLGGLLPTESRPSRRVTRSSFGRCRPGGRRFGRCTRRRRSGSPRSGGAATASASKGTTSTVGPSSA